MIDFLVALVVAGRYLFRRRADTALEVFALRQQLAVLKRKRARPALNCVDRAFWIVLRRLWPRWKDALLIVKPETVVGWHRATSRFYWRRRSRLRGGRPKAAPEIRSLIRRMAAENTGWGAPTIHGELLKLGFVVSERTVGKYLRRMRRRGDPAKRWLTFLHNHRTPLQHSSSTRSTVKSSVTSVVSANVEYSALNVIEEIRAVSIACVRHLSDGSVSPVRRL